MSKDAMKANREIMVKINVPEQVLRDILTTAVEGGSAYWLMAESVERDEQLNVTRIVNPTDAETEEPFDVSLFKPDHTSAHITAQTIFDGLRLLANGAIPRRRDLYSQLPLIQSGDADFDANDADVILQLGFFGGVMFG